MILRVMTNAARAHPALVQTALSAETGRGESRFGRLGRMARLLPGLLLAGSVALLGILLTPVLAEMGVVAGPMVVSLLLGLVFAQCRPLPDVSMPGLNFACRPLLRFAIVLLGLRIGLPQIFAVGASGLAAISLIVIITLSFGYWVSRRLGLSRDCAWLLASGHAICGAAAVAAADSVLRAKDRDVTQALTMVTLFGTLTMLLLPMLGSWLGLDANVYGFWVGGSVHEVAQAVAAGFACGVEQGEAASIIKLVRVAHLLPLGLVLGVVVARRSHGGSQRSVIVPWFVLGFAAVAVLDAVGFVPAPVAGVLRELCRLAMTVAMAALGLKSSLRDVARAGARPLLAAAATTSVIAMVAFLLALQVA